MCPILPIFIHRGVSVKRHDNSEHSEESHRAQGRLREGEKSRPFTCAQDDKINNLQFTTLSTLNHYV